MKSVFFFSAILFCHLANTQSVGIGTTTPNAKAALDISSTTKGLLIPSMTSVQRGLILSPPNGLMVYDTDQNQFYYYDGTSWRKMLNNTYWNQSSTHSWVYNSTDSVGIGTSVPTHRLDVNGNIRSRDDLLADGKVTAGGIVSGSSLQTAGNLVANGLGIVNGNLTTNSNLSVVGSSTLTGNVTTEGDLIVNNTGATLQLRDGSSVNKGFYQISGDDVRFGTNSGNSAGNVIVRMNGSNRFQFAESGRLTLLADNTPTLYFNTGGVNRAYLQLQGDNLRLDAPDNKLYLGDDMTVDDATGRIGIGTISPTEKLHVAGNLLVTGNTVVNGNAEVNGGRITATNTGNYNLVPVCYGRVNSNGSKAGGTPNFTVTRWDVGRYTVTCAQATASSILMVNTTQGRTYGHGIYISGAILVEIFDEDGDFTDASYHFIVIDP